MSPYTPIRLATKIGRILGVHDSLSQNIFQESQHGLKDIIIRIRLHHFHQSQVAGWIEEVGEQESFPEILRKWFSDFGHGKSRGIGGENDIILHVGSDGLKHLSFHIHLFYYRLQNPVRFLESPAVILVIAGFNEVSP